MSAHLVLYKWVILYLLVLQSLDAKVLKVLASECDVKLAQRQWERSLL